MIAAAFVSFGVLVVGWFVAPSRGRVAEQNLSTSSNRGHL